MFEVLYAINGNGSNQSVMDVDNLLEFLKFHKEKKIMITKIEDTNHHVYDYESLIKNLKL